MADRSMTRGDSYVFQTQILDEKKRPVNLGVGSKVWFTVKRAYALPDSMALIKRSTESGEGIVVLNAAAGQIEVEVLPAATAGCADAEEAFVYDIQVKETSGRIFTAEKGTFTVTPDVTRATA